VHNVRSISKDVFLNPIFSGNGKIGSGEIGLDSNLTEKSIDYSLSGYFASEENNFRFEFVGRLLIRIKHSTMIGNESAL